jgi:phosphoglycolate phosphatase-like HAD superfamily hydrolase
MEDARHKAYIFDLDGTLADMNGRNPYEQDTCDEDLCIEQIAQIARALDEAGYFILILSGRFDAARAKTKNWLHNNLIPYAALHMRADNDQRDDRIIKAEIFDEHIAPYYDVQAIFDDRPKVIRMWREKGVPVIDVGKGVEF